MLRIFDDILDWLEWIAPRVERIRRRNPNLASQLDRASTSVGANVCEGMGATAKSKRRAYRIALGEMRESAGLIAIAVRLRMIEAPAVAERDQMEKITATLIRLAPPWDE